MSEFESQRRPVEKELVDDVFKIGDLVIFNREHPAMTTGFGGNTKVPAVLELIEKYGEGPFRVVRIRENEPIMIEQGHNKQFLTLERLDGTPATTFNQPPSPSSWYKKSSPSE